MHLPKLGPQRPLEGQPHPARDEPGPLEASEELRAQVDDVLRESMAEQAAAGGRALGIPGHLVLPDPSLEKLWHLFTGQYHTDFIVSQAVAAGESVIEIGQVRQGFMFICRGIRVQAPALSRLKLYEGQPNTPGSFREVITNVQEYAGEPPGTLIFKGPMRIYGVLTLAEAPGQATIRLEGDLVARSLVSAME